MALSSFFSSFLNVVHADVEEEKEVESTQAEVVVEQVTVEEEEEPEDVSVNRTTCFVSMLMIFLVSCTR
jgi:uncharacterized protein YfdQ (DUF2303 family)